MRTLLDVCLIGMSMLAVFFLRRRRLSFQAYISWGLIALLLPVIGPFLIILTRPGD